MKNIYGIYLNNLRFDQIHRLYKEWIPEGKSIQKVDRINEMLMKC